MFNYKEARKFSKENVKTSRATIFGYYILYLIFQGIISGAINDKLDGFLAIFISTLVAGIVTPIQVGLFRIVTNIMNKESVSFQMLFDDYKYFANLFVIGFIANTIIKSLYSLFFIPGLLCSFIYVGVLYLFIYNSNLSLGDFFNKAISKIKEYFAECITLELSYLWIFLFMTIIYIIIATIYIIIVLTNVIDVAEFLRAKVFLEIIRNAIPLLIITIIYVVLMIIFAIRILPNLLLAEAKFYAAFKNDNSDEKKANFCPNCGFKVEDKFCSNCGFKTN